MQQTTQVKLRSEGRASTRRNRRRVEQREIVQRIRCRSCELGDTAVTGARRLYARQRPSNARRAHLLEQRRQLVMRLGLPPRARLWSWLRLATRSELVEDVADGRWVQILVELVVDLNHRCVRARAEAFDLDERELQPIRLDL